MASYENCPPDTSLTSIATLESIFEMEQLVIRLDNANIPWKVVEHTDIILKSFSDNLGHSTLLVESGKEKEALEILIEHRKQQLEGRECPGCTLWLGPTVNICPACNTDVVTGKKVKVDSIDDLPSTEEIENEIDEEFHSRIDDIEEGLDSLMETVDDLADVVENHADKLESLVTELAEIRKLLEEMKNN
ncbi:MAG: hypothetical protein JXR95_12090 [Deltaproteobacteria bacterium]|nr:hypothetical protein [Deltaproteobacteria bacterium]